MLLMLIQPLHKDKRQKIHDSKSPITLCARCADLDFDARFDQCSEIFKRVQEGSPKFPKDLFRASDDRSYYENAISVFRFDDCLSKPSDCPMCAFLRPLRIEPDRYERHKLLAFRGRDSWIFRPDLMDEELFNDYEDTVFMAVVPDIKTIPPCGYEVDWIMHGIPSTGAICRLRPEERSDPPHKLVLRARELGSEPNFDDLREELGLCRDLHGKGCVRQATHEPILRDFRLIDCINQPPVVEEHTWGSTYAALSYVWGTRPDDKIDWPKTVLDAVEVTKQLGLQYLWVDRLCIDQSNIAEKSYLVSRMATIYEEAEFTIVAAAGLGASHGLPGIRSTPRLPQPKYFLDSGNLLVSMLRDPRRDILESQYWTRGWTYQEGVLSNRRIVFTDHQVYWECRRMASHESVSATLFHMPISKEETSELVMSDCMLSGIFKGGADIGGSSVDQDDLVITDDEAYRLDYGFPIAREGTIRSQLRGLNEHIREFSRRRLTDDTDTLPAFIGIVGLYKKKEPLHLLHGIPMWIDRIAGGATGAHISFALSVSTWYHRASADHAMFVQEPCRRKKHLPSWTWAGWEGTVTWRAPPNLEHSAYLSDIINATDVPLLWAADIYLCSSNGLYSTRLLNTHSSNYLLRQLPTLIRLQNPYFLNSFRRIEERGKEWSWVKYEGRPGHQVRTSQRCEWDAKRYRIGRRLSCVGVSVPITEDQWTEKHICGELVSVLIFAGRDLKNEHGTARFLTLRRVSPSSDHWERVGTLYLTIPFLANCLDVQELFRKIPANKQYRTIVIQ
jgi:hypothetical protein